MEQKQCETCVYREMYYHLAKASEDAIRILIKSQQECEDIFLEADTSCQEKTARQLCSGCC